MSKIRFNCPSCKAKLKVPAHLAGVSGPCPKCGGMIVAPLQSETPERLEREPAGARANGHRQPGDSGAPVPADVPAVSPGMPGNVPAPHPVNEVAPEPSGRESREGAIPPPREIEAPPAEVPSAPVPVAHAQPPVQPSGENGRERMFDEPATQEFSPDSGGSPPSPGGFPKPLEQVSQTAAVALANAPGISGGASATPPVSPSAQIPPPPDAASTPSLPEAPSRAFLDLVSRISPESPSEQHAIPEDIFHDTPALDPGQAPVPVFAQPPSADPGSYAEIPGDDDLERYEDTQPLVPMPGYDSPRDEAGEEPDERESFVPKTQPIVVKRKERDSYTDEGAHYEDSDLPRLDASLGQTGSGTLHYETPAASAPADPTVVHLPPVGSESGEAQLEVPQHDGAEAERPPYRPPIPVALTPPNPDVASQDHYREEDYQEDSFPSMASLQASHQPATVDEAAEAAEEYPQQEYFEDEEPEGGTGAGSFEALLSGGREHAPVNEVPLEQEPVEVPSHLQRARSKDEILDELLGSAPRQMRKKRKKGLSRMAIVMLSTLGAVAVCASAGVYFAVEKLGGLTVTAEDVHGQEGLRNRQNKPGGTYILPETDTVPSSLDVNLPIVGEADGPAAIPTPESTEVAGSERENPAVPENIPIPEVSPETDGGASPEGTGETMEQTIERLVANGGVDDQVAALTGVGSEPGVGNGSPPEPPGPVSPMAAVSPEATLSPDGGRAVESPHAASPVAEVAKEPESSTGTRRDDYHPRPFYPAPGPDDPPLQNTHDLVDAFLRAPSWRERLPYTFQGKSLTPALEQYYQKWPDFSLERFKMRLFQMELDPEFGGPFWVYQVSESDAESSGTPIIIRVEDGNLKVDWEIFSEFTDRHFVKFQNGEIGAPHNFRLVAERISSYPGPDKVAFKDMDDYYCYELNPPYGDYREFSEYAFIRKGTPLAREFDAAVGLGDDPLAVIVTLDRKNFSHGIKHLVITKFVSEGWFN